MLYIFSGFPATGKTTLAKQLAVTLKATYLRIDSIEQTLRDNGLTDLYDEGYKVAFSLALDNLNNGMDVVADSTNPVEASRTAWINVAKQAKVDFVNVEVICSDKKEHKTRVETRQTDIANLRLPIWQSVITREYQPWRSSRIVIDTAGKTPEQSILELLQRLENHVLTI
ncbi:AAA family ATPase [Pseudoalteromonas sp. T1lg65]|uniref:AAA family ATPase n=1 Tax=Pseudoalteromonas sp. T1lg65 TaxID=2077101 RepID=UPI003F7949B7